MKLPFLFIFLQVAQIAFGQSPKIETIKQTNPITKEVYIFPKVIVSNSKSVTQKINTRLRESILGVPSNTKDVHIFDSVWRWKNVSNLSYKVSEVNASIISLTISGEGCGAYCEPFDYHFTFNAKTGNQLTLDSLFTHKGLITFLKTLNENKRQKLNNKLKEIKQSLTALNVKTDTVEIEQLSEMLSMYTDCLTNKIDIRYASNIQYLYKMGEITVYTDRCSAHYNMVYDELWTFVYKADLKNLKLFLNKYGLSLINFK